MSGDGFISRWSRRKTASKGTPKETPEAVRNPPTADAIPAQAATAPPVAAASKAPEPLPPVESLTPESDFTPFMKPEVDAQTRRKAVKMLFQDPRYNVMDGLDVYIDDYSKPDPLPEGWLAKMTQMARLGEYREPEPEAERSPEKPVEGTQVDAAAADTSDGASQPAQVPPSKPDV